MSILVTIKLTNTGNNCLKSFSFQVSKGDVVSPLVVVVVGQHEVTAAVGKSCSVEVQQRWCNEA